MAGPGWGSGGWGGSPWGGGAPLIPPPPVGAPDNLSFEISDGAAGARSWTLTPIDSWSEIAGYDHLELVPFGWEGFERGWGGNETFLFSFPTLADEVERARFSSSFFTPAQTFESFEVWVFPYYRSSAPFLSASFVGPTSIEAFEHDWANSPFGFTWGDVTSVAAPYAPFGAIVETFEAGWSNDPIVIFFDRALFSPVFGDNVENFEHAKPDAGALVDLAGVWTQATHGMPNDSRVSFVAAAGGSLPTGVIAGVLYFVTNSTTNTFKASLSSGGATVVPTTIGVGLTFTHEETDFWPNVISM